MIYIRLLILLASLMVRSEDDLSMYSKKRYSYKKTQDLDELFDRIERIEEYLKTVKYVLKTGLRGKIELLK